MFVASYYSTWGKPCFSKEDAFTLSKENKLYNKEKNINTCYRIYKALATKPRSIFSGKQQNFLFVH